MNYVISNNRLCLRCCAAALVLSPTIMVVPSLTRSNQDGQVTRNSKAEAAWVSAGFKFGWMSSNDDGTAFFSEKQVIGGLPAFRYSRSYKGLNLKPLPIIPRPFGLFLDDSPIDDMFLQGLGRLQNVRLFCLRFGPITDTGMKEIGRLKELTHLEITNLGNLANVDQATQTKSFNEGIKHFAGLNNLEVLNLSQTTIGDAGTDHLGDTKLRILNLGHSNISDAGIKKVANFKRLQVLNIAYTSITQDGIIALARLKQLQSLSLAGTAITNKELKTVGALQQLKELNLAGTKVSNQGLQALSTLTELTTLDVSNTEITKDGVERLKRALPKVTIRFNRITRE